MEKSFNLKNFIILAIIFAIISLGGLINSQKGFRTDLDILALPKNTTLTDNFDQVAGNIENIPRQLSFYDKIVELNSDIIDTTLGESNEQRKTQWNEKMKIERTGQSDFFRISVFDKDPSQAEIIANQTTRSLIFILSGYYNVKNEVGVSIIDGPITSSARSGKEILLWIGESLLLGALLSLILSWASGFLKRRMTAPLEEIRAKTAPKNLFPEKTPLPQEPAYTFEKKEEAAPKKEEIFEKETVANDKKAAAPGNLPVADDAIVKMFGAAKNGGYKLEEKSIPQEEPKKGNYREATPEEVKDRLNKLLSGSL